MDVPPTLADEESESGQGDIAAMHLAGRYTYAGREYVARHVAWVIRKGATPAFPGQWGFVGGSMGDDAGIIEGVDSDLSKAPLYQPLKVLVV